MNQLQAFFENAASEVTGHLRNRIRLNSHKARLERQTKLVAKRIRVFEKKHETDLRVSTSRLDAAETTCRQCTDQEAKSWDAYQIQAAKTDSLMKCIFIAAASFSRKKPTIKALVTLTEKLASDWRQAFQQLRKAEEELAYLKSAHHQLASEVESDRFAIRNLSAQIQVTNSQLNSEEAALCTCIKTAAQNLSLTAIARRQAEYPELDQKFFDDLRRLRGILRQCTSLNRLTKIKAAEEEHRSLAVSLQVAASEAIEDHAIPLPSEILLKGKGKLRQVATGIARTSDAKEPWVDTRVAIAERKQFEPTITLKRLNVLDLANEISTAPLMLLNRCVVESVHHEAEASIRLLSSRADEITQRILKQLFHSIHL